MVYRFLRVSLLQLYGILIYVYRFLCIYLLQLYGILIYTDFFAFTQYSYMAYLCIQISSHLLTIAIWHTYVYRFLHIYLLQLHGILVYRFLRIYLLQLCGILMYTDFFTFTYYSYMAYLFIQIFRIYLLQLYGILMLGKSEKKFKANHKRSIPKSIIKMLKTMIFALTKMTTVPRRITARMTNIMTISI